MTYDLNITFDDNLVTGNETIDTQHKELIDRIQNFVTACQNGDSKVKAIKMLDYLDEYTDFHFKEEEKLQEKSGYPERENHHEKHEEFKKTIQELHEYLQDYEGPTVSVVFGYFFPGGIFFYLEVVFSLNQFGDTLVLVGNGVRDIDFVFHPVGVFLEAEFLHVYGIVGVVVDSGHGTELVETFNQHTFRIEIGESERSGNVSHAPFLSPVFYRFDESGGYFRVVNEVYPPEADVLATPFLVGTVVDNGGYTSYDLVILVCQKIICFTEFECCILTLVKCIEHIVVKVGDGVRIALVHSVIETDKFLKFSLCRDFLDCNSHISYL